MGSHLFPWARQLTFRIRNEGLSNGTLGWWALHWAVTTDTKTSTQWTECLTYSLRTKCWRRDSYRSASFKSHQSKHGSSSTCKNSQEISKNRNKQSCTSWLRLKRTRETTMEKRYKCRQKARGGTTLISCRALYLFLAITVKPRQNSTISLVMPIPSS